MVYIQRRVTATKNNLIYPGEYSIHVRLGAAYGTSGALFQHLYYFYKGYTFHGHWGFATVVPLTQRTGLCSNPNRESQHMLGSVTATASSPGGSEQGAVHHPWQNLENRHDGHCEGGSVFSTMDMVRVESVLAPAPPLYIHSCDLQPNPYASPSTSVYIQE